MILQHNRGKNVAKVQSIDDVIVQHAAAVAEQDGSAPWELPGKLYKMKGLWQKIVLPCDWDISHASLGNLRKKKDAAYVCNTHDFVEANYDGTRWIYHLALIMGILFSRVVPYVFWPKEEKITEITDTNLVTQDI